VAEKENYSGESVTKLLEVTEKDRVARGQDLFTRSTALNTALIRGVAGVRNWSAGNWAAGAAQIALGVEESYGVSMFGNTNAETAKNALFMTALSAVLGGVTGYLAAGKPSVRLAFKPGTPGHNMVGVDEVGAGKVKYSDLRYDVDTTVKPGNVEAHVEAQPRGPSPATYSVAEVPRTSSQAAAAQGVADARIAQTQAEVLAKGTLETPMTPYKVLCNDCTTYASSVLNAAGVVS
jgi:hypothetical protein